MITVEKIGQGTYFEDAFKLSFKYDPVTVGKVKELAQRRYLPEEKAWEIPAYELPNLVNKVGINNIKSDDAVLGALKTKEIEDRREATQERLRNIKPSIPFDFTTAPLPHQIEAFNYGLERNALLIGDEQGLGKTKESIDIVVARKRELCKCLIVCGVNSVKYNWEAEIRTHSKEKSVMIDDRTMDQRVQSLNSWLKGAEYFAIINIERKGSTQIAKELNDAGYRNTVGKEWKPMDIPKFVYDCKNVGTMVINKERHDFESKQTIKLPEEEWVYVKNALPPIVTEEEWELICKIHDERVVATGSDKRGKGKKVSGYSFSGKLVCGVCGAPYWRKQRSTKEEYWVCSTKQQKGRKTRKRDSVNGKAGELNEAGCDNTNISYNSLMEIMTIISERLQANTELVKADMINKLNSWRKRIIEANRGATEEDLQKELSRKDKLLDALLDGILTKEEYTRKAESIENKIAELKQEIEANKTQFEDIAEIDRVLANIDEEVAVYLDENKQLKVEYILEHLDKVEIYPDKVIVIVPLFDVGFIVDKSQYVSRAKRRRKNDVDASDLRNSGAHIRKDNPEWPWN